MTASDNITARHFYHGTRADLKPGDLIASRLQLQLRRAEAGVLGPT
jgi:hypothetical protein